MHFEGGGVSGPRAQKAKQENNDRGVICIFVKCDLFVPIIQNINGNLRGGIRASICICFVHHATAHTKLSSYADTRTKRF